MWYFLRAVFPLYNRVMVLEKLFWLLMIVTLLEKNPFNCPFFAVYLYCI